LHFDCEYHLLNKKNVSWNYSNLSPLWASENQNPERCEVGTRSLIWKFSNWLNKMVTRPSRQNRKDSTEMFTPVHPRGLGARSTQELIMALDYEYRQQYEEMMGSSSEDQDVSFFTPDQQVERYYKNIEFWAVRKARFSSGQEAFFANEYLCSTALVELFTRLEARTSLVQRRVCEQLLSTSFTDPHAHMMSAILLSKIRA
jgi:hypothetical protein